MEAPPHSSQDDLLLGILVQILQHTFSLCQDPAVPWSCSVLSLTLPFAIWTWLFCFGETVSPSAAAPAPPLLPVLCPSIFFSSIYCLSMKSNRPSRSVHTLKGTGSFFTSSSLPLSSIRFLEGKGKMIVSKQLYSALKTQIILKL